MSAAPARSKSRHVYKSGAAGCGGKAAPTNAKNTGQPLQCPFCDRIFKQDGRLKEHLKSKHADESLQGETDAESSSTGGPETTSQSQSSYPVKTPKNLLHEWCQKNKRPAPKYKHVEVEGGFQCRVIVPDSKKSELDIILWFRETVRDSQEAHNRAAVVALHSVMGTRRLDRILQDDYRQQWHELEVAALEREEKLKANLRKTKKPQVQKELQSVFMSEGNRKLLENVLANDQVASSEAGNTSQPSENDRHLRSRLEEMGFRDSDIDAAVDQTSNLSSALDWLMLNAEECNLPARFAPQAAMSAVRVLQRATEDDEDISSLMEYGYLRRDCEAALRDSEDRELALAKLFCAMFPPVPFESDGADLVSLREEEAVAIASIYGEAAVVTSTFFKIDIEQATVDAAVALEVRIPIDSSYPFEIPVIGFRSKELDSAAIQDITRKVAERGLILLGTPMIYELVCYAPEALAEVLSKPQIPEAPSMDIPAELPASYDNPRQRARRNEGSRVAALSAEQVAVENARLKKEWEQLRTSSNYAETFAARKKLPAFTYRTELLMGINKSSVAIVCGETGCGKSTQVPQYLLEESIESSKGATCNIICTQPRRISAIGLADRVAKERIENVGRTVGYSVRLDSCVSKHTRLIYCTTGILLRRLLSDPELKGVTHVIVDEVHERTLEGDLLLLLLRSILNRTDAHLRVILMSATIDASTFIDYFRRDGDSEPSLLHIPGFTYPVRELYLEDALELTGYKISKSSRYSLKKKPREVETSVTLPNDVDSWESRFRCQDQDTDPRIAYSESTRSTLEIVDESIINYELIEVLLHAIFQAEVQASPVYGSLTDSKGTPDLRKAGSVLVFLPGMMEIKKLQSRLQSSKDLAGCGVQSRWVLALHGSLSGDEQKRVFLRPPPGVRKVVLATNVAETSITIDDVLYVIDTGRHKEMSYEHAKSLSSLQETWVSKASSKQRCGRAGRVQPGCCFRLFSRKQFKALDDQQLPEVLRVSLEGLSLKVKSLLGFMVEQALGQMPTPPDSEAVKAAVDSLKDIAAFDDEENLTPLGEHLAQMPMDARVAKMLIFGCLLRCLGPVLTIAASMGGRSLFVYPQEKREEANAAKLKLSGSSKSDHIAIVAAYSGWQASKKGGWNSENDYCSHNFLSREALQGIEASRLDYLNVLRDLGFVRGATSADNYPANLDSSSSSVRVIKAVVCAGFYPFVARVKHPEKLYAHTEGGTVAKPAAAHEVHYFTKTEGRVFLHPSSVNFRVGNYESPWLVITDKVKTSKVFVRECSMVPAYSLLIFGGGKMDVRHEKQLILVDAWMEFEAPARIAVLIRELRSRVDSLLRDKIGNTALDVSDSPVVSALLGLLEKDGF